VKCLDPSKITTDSNKTIVEVVEEGGSKTIEEAKDFNLTEAAEDKIEEVSSEWEVQPNVLGILNSTDLRLKWLIELVKDPLGIKWKEPSTVIIGIPVAKTQAPNNVKTPGEYTFI
jgi:hypothetical protein